MNKQALSLLSFFLCFFLIGCATANPAKQQEKRPKSSKGFDEYGNLMETSEYDIYGNKVKTTFEIGNKAYQAGGSESFIYDNKNRLIERGNYNNEGKAVLKDYYSYNEHGDLSSHVSESHSGMLSYMENYVYEYENGKIKQATITYLTGKKEKDKEERNYTYNSDGRLERIDIKYWSSDIQAWSTSYMVYKYTYEGGKLLSKTCTVVDYKENKVTGKRTEDLRRVEYTEYDTEGRITLERNTPAESMSHETTYTYNEYGLLETKSELLGESRKYTYTYWEENTDHTPMSTTKKEFLEVYANLEVFGGKERLLYSRVF